MAGALLHLRYVPRRRLADTVSRPVAVLATGVVVSDQITKAWARHALASPQHVVGPWWWRLTFNGGVSFSFNRGLPLVTAIATLVVAVVVVAVALRATAGVASWGFGLLVGGGVSNVLDRWTTSPPRVTDFVAVGSFPVFNLADAAITLGFVVLLFATMRGQRLVRPW